MNKKKRFLVAIKFSREEAPKKRLLESFPAVEALIQKYSNKDCQLAFRAEDGSLFGFLMKTDASINDLHRELFGEIGRSTSALLTGDELLIIECGETFDGRGLSRAWTWLQHH